MLRPIFFSWHWWSSAPALASTPIFELVKNRSVLFGGSHWDRQKRQYESFKLCPYFNCPAVLGNLFCSFSSDPTDCHWVSGKGLLQVKIKMIYKTCKLAKTFRKPAAEVSPEIIGKYSLTFLIMCSFIFCHKTITLLSIVTCWQRAAGLHLAKV